MKANDRKDDILDAAVRVAQRVGYAGMKRDAIAVEAGVSFGLVTIRLGTMENVKRSVMRAAIRRRLLPLIAEGLAIRDPHALKADAELRSAAGAHIAASVE